MQQQKLCLKWNNHTGNLLSVLGSFQQQDILVDVTLSCEGRNIKAHKMILSACSPYFQSLFLENPCQHPIVIINGMKYEDITAILNFMYKGEVNVSHDGLSSFLQAAEALKVKGLAEVCGEKKTTNSDSHDVDQDEPMRPQRTETPNKKKHRSRKRSLSDSNRSDDEGTARKHTSPEVHELSGDESFTGDMSSNGPPLNSLPRVPQNVFSRSHQSSSNLAEEGEDDYEVEPSKLMEQTLTTENVSMSNSGSSDHSLRIERIMGNATEMESSSMQEPDSPPDIKPIIEYGDSNAGPSEGIGRIFNDQSQPGPSNFQESSHLHDNSQAQGKGKVNHCISKGRKRLLLKKKSMNNNQKFECFQCKFVTTKNKVIARHLNSHADCIAKAVRKSINDKKFICVQCCFRTDSEKEISDHLHDHVRPTTYSCENCPKKFSVLEEFQVHVQTHKTAMFCCDHCDAVFTDINHLSLHRKGHKNVFSCRYCSNKFYDVVSYLHHKSQHDESD